MMVRKDSWSGSWCREKLIIEENIDNIELISPNMLRVEHSEHGVFHIATMSLNKIEAKDLQDLINGQSVDFVLNVSSEPYLTTDAIELAEKLRFGIGGLGDSMRALRNGELSQYLNPEVNFVYQGLKQHSRVSSVKRLDNRRFHIERFGLDPVVIISLNEYELTAESIRNAIDKFPSFNAVLKSNPNGDIGDSAYTAAQHAAVAIFRWGELLGALNKPW